MVLLFKYSKLKNVFKVNNNSVSVNPFYSNQFRQKFVILLASQMPSGMQYKTRLTGAVSSIFGQIESLYLEVGHVHHHFVDILFLQSCVVILVERDFLLVTTGERLVARSPEEVRGGGAAGGVFAGCVKTMEKCHERNLRDCMLFYRY